MSESDYVVRRVSDPEPEHLDQVYELVTEMVDEGAALGWVERPSRSDVGELLADLIQGADFDDACLVVAEQVPGGDGDSEIVGFAYWTRRDGETEQPHADIGRVAVSSRARGGGLGRRLMEGLIEYARQVGVEILTLDVRGNNHAAMHVYEKLGFVEYGRIPDFVAVENQRWDNVYFWLDLRGKAEHADLELLGDTPEGPGASELR